MSDRAPFIAPPIQSSAHAAQFQSRIEPRKPADRALRFLFDLNHPAHFHLFRHVIPRLQASGHEVKITCRRWQVLEDLIRAAGLEHEVVSEKGKGYLGMLREMIVRDWTLARIARRFQPDVLVSKHGLYVSHVGRLLGIPSVSFEDTELATMQIRLSWRLLDHVYSESHFQLSAGRKHRRYDSLNAFAYLHPNHFTPDPSILDALEIGRDEPFILLRLIAWDATHDFAHRENRDERRRKLVAELEKLVRVVIIPEKKLPEYLERRAVRVPAHRFHDLLAHASACVGEGRSIAYESASLGVPTLYFNSLVIGTFAELARYGALECVDEMEDAPAIVARWMSDREATRSRFAAAREKLLADKFDPVPYFVEELIRIAEESAGKRRGANGAARSGKGKRRAA